MGAPSTEQDVSVKNIYRRMYNESTETGRAIIKNTSKLGQNFKSQFM